MTRSQLTSGPLAGVFFLFSFHHSRLFALDSGDAGRQVRIIERAACACTCMWCEISVPPSNADVEHCECGCSRMNWLIVVSIAANAKQSPAFLCPTGIHTSPLYLFFSQPSLRLIPIIPFALSPPFANPYFISLSKM